ncbi:DNA primase [Thiotrichales bacterium 19S11-10]|nr:DNA primase [Thiotrichales bacterium 19S11-10]
MGKGLIPRDFINQLVASTDIVEVISKFIPLKKRGINLTACCPFHDEKTPSFYVSPQKQIYHCFGCGAGGNVISFLKDYERLSFVETIEEIALLQGLEIPYEKSTSINNHSTQDTQQIDLLYEVMDKANKLFYWQLKHHANANKAINYIKSRHISATTAKLFSLGFAPDQWQTLLNTLSKQYPIGLLKLSGLVTSNDSGRSYDKFRNRLIFPIRNRRGKLIAFGGRALDKDQNPKYLNSPETPIFHKSNEVYGLYEIRKLKIQLDFLLVTEGYLDVISLHEHGFKKAVATLGTALTEQHLKRLFRETSVLIFAFDGDQAGQQAAIRALHLALPSLNQQHQVKFLTLPDSEDPDSFICSQGLEAFDQLVKEAKPALDFAISNLLKETNLEDSDAKARTIEKAIELLSKMDSAYQITFKQSLAKALTLTEKQLDYVIKHKKVTPLPVKNIEKPLILKKERLSLIEKAIALILQTPKAILSFEMPNDTYVSSTALQLLKQVIEQAKETPHTALLLEHITNKNPHQKQYLYAISAIDFPFLSENEIQTELNATFIKLKAQNDDIMLNRLIEKSKHTNLSLQEKEQLKQLLTRH